MMYLAQWIYSDEKLQGGVTENKLIAKATEYLYPRRYEDRDEAENAARDFINFCQGRAWVFTDIGLTKEGERLYQFTHRTFLEYFTACYLARNYAMPNKLWEFLKTKIARGEWDVVSQLAIQILNKNIEGAGDQILMLILDESDKREIRIQGYYLSFALRCVGFLVPSPTILRSIIQRSLSYLVNNNFSSDPFGFSSPRRGVINIPIIQNITQVADENQKATFQIVKKQIIGYLKSNSIEKKTFIFVVDLVLNLRSEGLRYLEHQISWTNLPNEIMEECRPEILKASQESYTLIVTLFERGDIFIDDLIKIYGLERSCFEAVEHPAYRYYSVPPIYTMWMACLSSIGDWPFKKFIEQNVNRLPVSSFLGEEIVPTKNSKRSFAIELFSRDFIREEINGSIQDFVMKYPLQVFILFALYFESHYTDKVDISIETREPFIVMMKNLFILRKNKVPPELINNCVDHFKVEPEVRKIMENWGKNELNFIRPESLKKSLKAKK